MTSNGGGSGNNLSNIWKFLDKEDSSDQTWKQIDKKIGNQPTQKNFLRPAMFGVKRNSTDSVREHNGGLQLPTFPNRFNGGINTTDSIKLTTTPQAKKLPRTQVHGLEHEENVDDIYAMPNKTKKAPVETNDKNSPFTYLNGNIALLPSNNTGTPPSEDHYDVSSAALFKRYEAGSILSTISSERVPGVYNDKNRQLNRNGTGMQVMEEVDDDNVIFAQRKSSFSKVKLWGRKRSKGEKTVGGKSCCTKKVALIMAVVIFAIAAAVAIGVGVGVTQSRRNMSPETSADNTKLGNTTSVRTTSRTTNTVASTTSTVLRNDVGSSTTSSAILSSGSATKSPTTTTKPDVTSTSVATWSQIQTTSDKITTTANEQSSNAAIATKSSSATNTTQQFSSLAAVQNTSQAGIVSSTANVPNSTMTPTSEITSSGISTRTSSITSTTQQFSSLTSLQNTSQTSIIVSSSANVPNSTTAATSNVVTSPDLSTIFNMTSASSQLNVSVQINLTTVGFGSSIKAVSTAITDPANATNHFSNQSAKPL